LWEKKNVKFGPPSLRKEHRWRMFEDRVLARIIGPKREEIRKGA
jgi:hypothetical protein